MSMNQTIKETIHANGIDITVYTNDFKIEYISLTDIARFRSTDPRFTIHSWLRSRDIVEFLGLWECLYNPDFKRADFDTLGLSCSTLSTVPTLTPARSAMSLMRILSVAIFPYFTAKLQKNSLPTKRNAKKSTDCSVLATGWGDPNNSLLRANCQFPPCKLPVPSVQTTSLLRANLLAALCKVMA